MVLKKQAQAAIDLRNVFTRYRYAFTKRDLLEIHSLANETSQDKNLSDDEARARFVVSEYKRIEKYIEYGVKLIDAKTDQIADKLRNSCEY